MKTIEGNIIDIFKKEIYPGIITIGNGKIIDISRNSNQYEHYISPGFVDAHVHIESSMLIPEKFSELIIQRGTTAIINDPHEIANVLGLDGIYFMLEHSRKASIKIFTTIPSCVPATPYDFSGSTISSADIEKLLESDDFIGLSEVMNVPGVINSDPEVIKKINIALSKGLKIDGHAPGLKGEKMIQYVKAGITTDHECTSIEEAKEKITTGMKILIREGSAAKNYEALKSLIETNPNDVMFCTDDSHPDDLITKGHIDKIVRKALMDGFDFFDIIKIAAFNPIKHYNIDSGVLRTGDPADFVIFRDLKSFHVISTYIGGVEKFNSTKNNYFSQDFETADNIQIFNINNFNRKPILINDIRKTVSNQITAIKVYNGEIVTSKSIFPITGTFSNFESDISRDILKIVYLNRYIDTSIPQIAFITGFQLKNGAFATTISHDSHNIIAVGCKDQDILDVINIVIGQKGGIALKNNDKTITLPLPIAGIMTDKDGKEVAHSYEKLNNELKIMGCRLDSPLMTLSFMSLIVIPQLKIGENGLFDFDSFEFME